MRNAAILLGLCLTVSGCTGIDESLRDDPIYQLGYGDGCSSAHSSGSGFSSHVTRNPEYAGKSDAYDAGWRAGFGGCGGDTRSLTHPGEPWPDRN